MDAFARRDWTPREVEVLAAPRGAPCDRARRARCPRATSGTLGLAPIDRQQYSIRFSRKPPQECREAKGQFKVVMLPADLDAQFKTVRVRFVAAIGRSSALSQSASVGEDVRG
jgi:hypothetical protein